ncbi:hypothetical protein THOE12_120023 [Vibrio rotiferianus]|nr:hypothetical protein THOE12_120023 [Vibrio rotiferianus]
MSILLVVSNAHSKKQLLKVLFYIDSYAEYTNRIKTGFIVRRGIGLGLFCHIVRGGEELRR